MTKKNFRDSIEAHVAATGSELGAKVLADFDYYLPHFKKLIPNEYKKMITLSAKLQEKGLTSEQAQMEAFYESIGSKALRRIGGNMGKPTDFRI